MSEMNVASQVLIVIGLLFDLFATLGLLRLPDVYNRIQAATKCVTIGTCFILTGVLVHAVHIGMAPMGTKAFLCALFVLLTTPVGAHAIARGAHRAGVKLWDRSVTDEYAELRESPHA